MNSAIGTTITTATAEDGGEHRDRHRVDEVGRRASAAECLLVDLCVRPGSGSGPRRCGRCLTCREARALQPQPDASSANPIEAQFGPLHAFTMAGSNHPNHTVLARELQAYLRWCKANARHPDIRHGAPPRTPVSAANGCLPRSGGPGRRDSRRWPPPAGPRRSPHQTPPIHRLARPGPPLAGRTEAPRRSSRPVRPDAAGPLPIRLRCGLHPRVTGTVGTQRKVSRLAPPAPIDHAPRAYLPTQPRLGRVGGCSSQSGGTR
jgi:hypothetical protein